MGRANSYFGWIGEQSSCLLVSRASIIRSKPALCRVVTILGGTLGRLMIITGVFHVAIKTADLDATVSFNTQGLGLKQRLRPDFGFLGHGSRCRPRSAKR